MGGTTYTGKKGKKHNTYIAPQAATAAALYVTDRADVVPIGRRVSPRPRDFDLRRTAIRSTGLPFNGLHHRNPCKGGVWGAKTF